MVVTVLIDQPPYQRYHAATLAALDHAADHLAISTQVRVVPTDTIGGPGRVTAHGSAVLVGPGSPYRDPEAVHAVVRLARERGIPLVGT